MVTFFCQSFAIFNELDNRPQKECVLFCAFQTHKLESSIPAYNDQYIAQVFNSSNAPYQLAYWTGWQMV